MTETRINPPATRVPFLDLGPTHVGLKAAILADIADVIDSGAFINGPAVATFEAAFAEYVGTNDCIGVASGLDALRLVLLSGGIEPGDEVVLPANTFAATVEAVLQARGAPVLVDASESDYNADVGAVEAAIGARTRFLMPVHLYGQLSDLRALQQIASRTGVSIIEDACQAHGATRDGIVAGTAGIAAAFSFYPGKNLGAMGDAGALTTDDAELAARMRALREHGQTAKYHHEYEGYTSRLDTLQALVLLRKLEHLARWTEERRAIARNYSQALEGVGDLRLPPVAAGSDPVWHLYVVRTADPAALAGHLAERGIGTGRHYPQPVHEAPAFAHLGYSAGAFPVTERLAREVLSLPIYPGMTEAQQESVVVAISEFFAG
jgi:dTDP-4-amino-4,6-dideoxygalactose transaminase